jgi:hypothetical protein
MGNGKAKTDRGVVVVATGVQTKDGIEVYDETGNASGWKWFAGKEGLIEITKEDYDLVIACNEDWTEENETKVHQKIAEVLSK